MKEIKISKIGLTQFAIMNGAVLKSYNKESGAFVLDSEKSSQEWRLCYAASPFSQPINCEVDPTSVNIQCTYTDGFNEEDE